MRKDEKGARRRNAKDESEGRLQKARWPAGVWRSGGWVVGASSQADSSRDIFHPHVVFVLGSVIDSAHYTKLSVSQA